MTEYWNIVDEVYEFDGRPYLFIYGCIWMKSSYKLKSIRGQGGVGGVATGLGGRSSCCKASKLRRWVVFLWVL